MDAPELVDVSGMLEYTITNPSYSSVPNEILEDCQRLANSFHHTGIVLIRDPQVSFMLESLFQKYILSFITKSEQPQKR